MSNILATRFIWEVVRFGDFPHERFNSAAAINEHIFLWRNHHAFAGADMPCSEWADDERLWLRPNAVKYRFSTVQLGYEVEAHQPKGNSQNCFEYIA